MEHVKIGRLPSLVSIYLNKVPAWLFLVIILSFNFLSFGVLPNEEHYLALAKQFMDPNWLPNSFLLNEWAGERLFYQYLAGFLLNFLSFPAAAMIGKIIIIVAISYPLSILFRNINLNNLEVLIVLQLFFFGNQDFFAGEFIIGTFEPKALGYVFVFFSLIWFLRERLILSVLFAVIATYFHFLVGGWFLLFLNIYRIVYQFKLREWLILNILYFVLVAPFIIYLYQGVSHIPSEQDGLSYNYLITAFRNPWHTIIDSTQVVGIVSMICALLLSLLFIQKHTEGWALKLTRLNVLIMAVVLFFVVVSFFDKQYFFIKFFPYRPASLSLFLFVITLAVSVKNVLKADSIFLNSSYLVFMAFLVPVLFNTALEQYYSISKSKNANLPLTYEYIRTHTDRDDTFLFLGYTDPMSVKSKIEASFTRHTNRDLLVLFKFAKYDEHIYEWYQRLKFYEELNNNPSAIKRLRSQYWANYVISKYNLDNTDGYIPIMVEGEHRLYKIDSRK